MEKKNIVIQEGETVIHEAKIHEYKRRRRRKRRKKRESEQKGENSGA